MRRWSWVIAAFALIGSLTLLPDPENAWSKHFWCWSCGAEGDTADFFLNVILFVPLGAALRQAGVRGRSAIVVVAATTILIEALQSFVIVGRDASVRDVVTNVLGGIIGYFVAFRLDALWNPSRVVARRLAWIAAVLWVAHSAFAMFLFQPAMTTNQLFSQIAPKLANYDVFAGRVGRATVNEATVFSGPFPPDFSAEAWASEPIELAATVQGGAPTRRYAPILALVDDAAIEIASLGESNGDLVFRTRTRGEALQLRAPIVVVSSIFPHDAPAVAYGRRGGTTLVAGVRTSPAEQREVKVALRPALAWMFWWQFDIPRAATVAVMTALWLGIPFLAIAFWSVRGWQMRVLAFVPVVFAGAFAHVVAPLAFHADALGPWSDAVSIVAGALCGLALGALRKSGSEP
jgi:VanZ family protein